MRSIEHRELSKEEIEEIIKNPYENFQELDRHSYTCYNIESPDCPGFGQIQYPTSIDICRKYHDDLSWLLNSIATSEGYTDGVVLIDSEDHELCKLNGVDSYRNRSAIGNNIEIGLFDDNDLLIASFFHELGHFKTGKSQGHKISTVANEASAWTTGFEIASKYGFKWSYDSKEAVYARKCIASYIMSEYDDMKEYYDLEKNFREGSF